MLLKEKCEGPENERAFPKGVRYESSPFPFYVDTSFIDGPGDHHPAPN